MKCFSASDHNFDKFSLSSTWYLMRRNQTPPMPNAYRVIAVLFVICLILLLHHFTIQFDSEDPNTTRDYNFNRARPKGNTAFRPADGDIISIQGGLDSLEAEKAGRQNRIISMALYGKLFRSKRATKIIMQMG